MTRGGGYYLLGSRLAAATHALPDPCVVVLAGARLRDEDLPRLAAPGVALLPIDKVAPAGLLNALMCADIGQGQAGHLVEAIESDPLLSRVPRTLWFAVLRAPQRMWTLDRLAAEVKFPKSRTKALVREAGFSDVRHFFTRVRANACRWMLCAGIDPPLARHHCGIIDRTTFERACGRADVNVPWRHVREGNPGT